jgi:amidase
MPDAVTTSGPCAAPVPGLAAAWAVAARSSPSPDRPPIAGAPWPPRQEAAARHGIGGTGGRSVDEVDRELSQASLESLTQRMDRGQLTAERLVERLMALIASRDRAADGCRAVQELNPEAALIAAGLDRERSRLGPRGPLHGIPVLLKDNLDTADLMHTSAGSLALAQSRAARDSAVAERLRQAGAVILGKACMTEWANFMTEGMPNGYSSRGGQVRNPYGPGVHDPGGSSSGCGAAVAEGTAPLAVGTETQGSILSPAAQNSVVGVKPTVGRISRRGIVPISVSQDTAGPLARSVRDAAVLLAAMSGEDAADPATRAVAALTPAEATAGLGTVSLAGKRFGVPRGRYTSQLPEGAAAVFEAALDDLRRAGAEVIDPIRLSWDDAPADIAVMVHEFKPALNAYLGALGPLAAVHSLAELIAFNLSRPQEMLRYGQTLLLRAEATSGTLLEEAYLSARLNDLRRSREEGIDLALIRDRLDAILFCGAAGSAVAAKAGHPSVCVPAGYAASGLPVGLTFTGAAWSEPSLLGLAAAYEQATARRRPPDR